MAADKKTKTKQPAADELVRVRVAPKQEQAVRVGEIWLTPGGHEENVRYGDASKLLKAGELQQA